MLLENKYHNLMNFINYKIVYNLYSFGNVNHINFKIFINKIILTMMI